MSITTPTQSGTGFLTFNSLPPRIWLTGPSPHAPEKALQHWKSEGYDATYLPYNAQDQATYIRTLKSLHNDLELGETYALIAFHTAASVVLRTAQKPLPKCCAIVAYYPPALPPPKHKYPPLLRIAVHVAGLSQPSPRPETCEWPMYLYERCAVGFADPESPAYSGIQASLAWSRSLSTVRRGFKQDIDVSGPALAAFRGKFLTEDPDLGAAEVVRAMSSDAPHATLVPTAEGGIGRRALQKFYAEFFIPSLVDDFAVRLVSRTVGVDRVVDEMVVSFTHSEEVDWILPGVAPTGRFVEIAMVSVVAVRGGKLVSEHMYWDQASVLVQVGLLDPKLVSEKAKGEGVEKVPVVGREGVRLLVEPRQEGYNGLLKEAGLLESGGMNGNGVNGS